MKYYIGLDNGGTNTKAAIFDIYGKEIGEYTIDTEVFTPAPGFVERDMERMWEANCEVIRGVLNKTNIPPSSIAALGLSGHGKGIYLWSKEGKPLRRGILSTDQRALKIVKNWKEDGTEERAFKISYQNVMACQPVALLAWLKKYELEQYQNIQWVFECKDYIRFRLTGVAGAELTDYSGANFLNLKTKKYDKELLKIFGIEEIENALPPLCKADEIFASISLEATKECGLLEGTPVIGGMFDINACAIGSGVIEEDKICMIAGTWSINEYIRKKPVIDGSVQMNSIFAISDYYLVEESSPTSAGNLEWFIRQFLPELRKELKKESLSIHEEIDRWVEEIDILEPVPIFLPFIMASNVHPNAKGSLIGLTLNHTRKHIVRAFFEGITFGHRYHLEKLLETKNKQEEKLVIRLSGGAAQAEVWAKMFADICGLPVETLDVKEVGALGVAIACAKAVGEYKDIAQAVSKMVRISGRYEPDRERKKQYDIKYSLYKKIIQNLENTWDSMQNLYESKKNIKEK